VGDDIYFFGGEGVENKGKKKVYYNQLYRLDTVDMTCRLVPLGDDDLPFNIIKNHIRNKRQADFPLWLNVVNAVSQVTHEKLWGFYKSCLSLSKIISQGFNSGLYFGR